MYCLSYFFTLNHLQMNTNELYQSGFQPLSTEDLFALNGGAAWYFAVIDTGFYLYNNGAKMAGDFANDFVDGFNDGTGASCE